MHVSQLIGLLLLNMPELAYVSNTNGVRLLTKHADHPYALEVLPPDSTIAKLTIIGSADARDFSAFGPHRAKQLLGALQESLGSTTEVAGLHLHPRLDRLACLWAGKRRWSCTRKSFKIRAMHRSNKDVMDTLGQRMDAWKEEDPVIHAALKSISWKQLCRWSGLDVWGERLLYRLKTRGLKCYDRLQMRIGCPHGSCIGRSCNTLTHTFWQCASAAKLWAAFIARWTQLGLVANVRGQASCFTFHLATLPVGFVDRAQEELFWLSSKSKEATKLRLHGAAADCWRIGVLTVLKLIWKWRNDHYSAGTSLAPPKYKAILGARLQDAYCTVENAYRVAGRPRAHMRVIHVVVGALSGHWEPTLSHTASGSTLYVLFFDGGSRGNPGPGGSGAVIPKVDRDSNTAEVVWAASMSYASVSTTNNQAEYRGLLQGILHAQRTPTLRPLHVVGDSQLILRQQLHRTAPKAAHLRTLYQRCRVGADRCGVQSWSHHLRAFNKTADALANMAMDTTCSRQFTFEFGVDSNGVWAPALEFISGDLQHWMAGVAHADVSTLPAVSSTP